MKKALSLVSLLAALASTAAAAPYYLPQPAAGELTPYDWQPVYSVDAFYNWSSNDAPDTVGARLNFSLYSNASSTVRHQFTISAGYETGSNSYTIIDPFYEPAKYRLEMEKLPITLGYDINLAVNDSVMFDFGIKAGYAFGFLTGKVYDFKETANTGGFTYGLTAGIKVLISDDIYARVAYEFTRTYFSEDLPSHVNFSQHGVVLGIGCTF